MEGVRYLTGNSFCAMYPTHCTVEHMCAKIGLWGVCQNFVQLRIQCVSQNSLDVSLAGMTV